MKKIILTALGILGLTINSFGGSSMTPSVVDLPVVVQQVSNLTVEVATKVSTNSLASTTNGTEGIRMIGAFGGYRLDGFLKDTALRGVARDLPNLIYSNSPLSNLTVSWTEGDIYDPENGYFHLAPSSHTLVDNSVNYAYWNHNDPSIIQWTTGSRASIVSNVYIATFSTAFGMIIEAHIAVASGDLLGQMNNAQSDLAPSQIKNGLVVFPTGVNLSNIVQTSGIEYHDMTDRIQHDSIDLSSNAFLVAYGHTNSGMWSSIITNILPIGLRDTGSNIVATTSGKWYRGIFVANAQAPHLSWILPNYEYDDETNAIAGNDPALPSGFDPYMPVTYAYVFSGDDVELRTNSTYWLDRRFMTRRGIGSVGSGGGGGATPTLEQVLIAGQGTGGRLMDGMGDPVNADQASSKGYVDKQINKINNHRTYVDQKLGDDVTAKLESSILPFKTIQAAINASAADANNTNRYSVSLSSGSYVENVTMSNYVSLAGNDIPSTFIIGQLIFPTNYVDVTGSEIALLSIRNVNAPALVINAGDDNAYIGIRSCALYSDYTDENVTNKSVVLIQRGLGEMYSTTYTELNLNTTNGLACNASIFEHTTDPANSGLSQFTSFSSSSIINCTDTNDDVSMMYTHDNTDSGCINEMIGGNFNIRLDTDLPSLTHYNKIKLVSHKRAIGRSLSMGNATRLYMDETNSCNLFIAFSSDGTGDNVAISRNNHIRVVSGSSSNVWFGAAVTTNDNIRIYDTEIIQNNAFNHYPQKYTAEGSLGDYYINTPHQNGDQILGGALDLSALSTVTQTIPETGHVRMYANTYAGLENLMFQDSSGNIGRVARDNFFNGYNSETTTLRIGEAVYVSAGLSADQTPIVKRCDASDPSTMPCDGVVVQVGNIATGSVGRIMRAGRTESTFNTASFTSGDKLYVPVKINGLSMVTNVAPIGTNIVQIIGKAHLIGVNGKITVYTWKPDTLGDRVPQDYVTYDKPIFSDSQFIITNSGSAKISVSDISAGTTNTYILPSEGGTLATYANIQLVPINVTIGEINGIIKGRVVYQNGSDTNGVPIAKYADCHNTAQLPVIGVALASGNYGDNIEVANFGPLKGFNTSAFAQNDLMYLGTNGTMSTIPSVLSDATILIGTCLISDSVNGSMLVNMRSYFQDGEYAGSMRYSVKNASTGATSSANFYLYNNINEGMRMGIRCQGHQNGPGSYIVNDAGQLLFANTRRNRFVWNIDMTDSGNIYNHVNWPLMALVPQMITSNAFLGIGTTNPLTMLDVIGSTTASNVFRRSTDTYVSNELITYGAVTNLVTVVSNIVVGMNTNLSNQITTASNTLASVDTNLNAKITSTSNTLSNVDTNLQGQVTASTNRIQNIENQTNAWSSSNTKFLANIGTTFNYTLPQPLTKVLYTNLISNIGGTYSNSAARWTPGVSNVFVQINGSIRITGAANDNTILIQIYKNDLLKSTVINKTLRAGTFSETFIFTDITTNSADYYEVWSTLSNARATTGSGADNWWSGQIVY